MPTVIIDGIEYTPRQNIAPLPTMDRTMDLITAAERAISDACWWIGESAIYLDRGRAKSEVDELLADRLGVTQAIVAECRLVWTSFMDVRGAYPQLFWSHFRSALDWSEDAADYLAWANEQQATAQEMIAYRRVCVGGDQEPTVTKG